MRRTTVISTGEKAFRLISEPNFIRKWLDLYGACSWGTVFQSPDFVKVWYETYREKFSPVILTMTGPDGELCGLLTLAENISSGQLVYAGDVFSEYQVWLAHGDAKDTFILEALALLGEMWPRQVLMLRYLPPGTRLGPLEKSGWIRNMVLLRPSSRPLIDLDQGQRIERSLKSKQVKLNRLKKLGTVSFRRVENAEFSEVLLRVWPLYEFRQIGQYNSSPLVGDADLKRFLVAMAKHPDAVHMTVLKVDEAIIAWLLGIQGNGYFHLTATGFSPFHARHSPAMLHMLMLAKSLNQERSVFDLTPGGDKYKDQLATCHEVTHTLYFFPSFRAAIEYKQTRILAGKAVKKVVRIALKNPARSMAASFFGGKRDTPFVGNQHPRELGVRFRLHKFDAAYFGRLDERVDAVRKNSVADLIRYESTQAQSLRDFVREARGFIDQGADAYTLVRGGLLVASCWIMTGERAPSAGLANYGVPAGTALLVGFYVHASEDPAKMLSICMEKWRGEIAPVKKATEIIIGIPETDVFRDILVSGEETPEGLLSGNQVIAVGCQDMVGK